jgi:hypothetical protein
MSPPCIDRPHNLSTANQCANFSVTVILLFLLADDPLWQEEDSPLTLDKLTCPPPPSLDFTKITRTKIPTEMCIVCHHGLWRLLIGVSLKLADLSSFPGSSSRCECISVPQRFPV